MDFEVKAAGEKRIVDVVGYLPGLKIAVECGDTDKGKILVLQEHYDIVIHMPYCHTPDFYQDNRLYEQIQAEIASRKGW